MSTKAGELKKEVTGYFSSDAWNLFLDSNFKMFSRYVRDQCLEARKHFKDNDISAIILERALEYCIENKTYSMANLNDTYKHFLKESLVDSIPPVINVLKSGRRRPAGVDISKPDLEIYRDILKTSGGRQ